MQLHPDTTRAISAEAVRTLAAAAAAIIGLSLDTWVKIATLCALVLSGGYTAWKWHHDWRRAKRQDAAEEDDAT